MPEVLEEQLKAHGYRIKLVKDSGGDIVGALVEGPRMLRPVYVPKNPASPVRVNLPESVKSVLRKKGFQVA